MNSPLVSLLTVSYLWVSRASSFRLDSDVARDDVLF